MRRLILLCLLAFALWSAWWLIAAVNLRGGIDDWFAQRQAEGWQAEAVSVSVSGYPMQLDATLDRPALADPDTGVAVSASHLRFSAPAWWPGHVTAFLPQDDISFATTNGMRQLNVTNGRAGLRLKPGNRLELDRLGFSSGRWTLSAPEGSLWAASGLDLSLTQDAEVRETYSVAFDAPDFQPGSLPRATLRIPADWPVTIDSLALEMSVVFERPLDRRTIEQKRPQPRRIDLKRAEAQWGALLVRLAAGLDVRPDGRLNGEFSIQARNWRDMLTLAETAGHLPAQMRPQLENILAALARGGGNPDSIDVTLSINDGRVFLGFIPLGDAPRLILP